MHKLPSLTDFHLLFFSQCKVLFAPLLVHEHPVSTSAWGCPWIP